jgi:hypothetical protein
MEIPNNRQQATFGRNTVMAAIVTLESNLTILIGFKGIKEIIGAII